MLSGEAGLIVAGIGFTLVVDGRRILDEAVWRLLDLYRRQWGEVVSVWETLLCRFFVRRTGPCW